jgi:prepilin-type N-terminal cleavage/methylation domain-containing protein
MQAKKVKINRKGYTLLEMLIALTISTLLLSLVMKYLQINNKQNALIHAISDLQENSRVAQVILNHSLEAIGSMGCANLSATFPIKNRGVSAKNLLTPFNAIQVFRGDGKRWSPSLPLDHWNFRPKKGTDVLLIRQMASLTNKLKRIQGHQLLIEPGPVKFKSKQNILIADCKQAVLATILKVRFSKSKDQILTLSGQIPNTFNIKTAEVGELLTSLFYVRDTRRKNKENLRIYALYRMDDRRKWELIPNVVNMKIHGFILTPSRFLRRVLYGSFDGHLLTGLEMDLLFRSHSPVLANAKSYRFQQHLVKPNDHYLYQPIKLWLSLRVLA